MEPVLLKQILCKPELGSFPVAVDLDFGHTTPIFTFPVGGSGQVEVDKGSVRFSIQDH
jgi:muramoyltetrapeptide carboxypeptidase LdcA involved in peptidoglycan recycling